MVSLADLPALLRRAVTEWRNVRAADLLFTHRADAILAGIIFIGLCGAILIARAMTRSTAGRSAVALPAVLAWSGRSWASAGRHGTLLLFLAGLPFFVMALADPYSALTRREVTFPGRRIALMIDASSSMMARFPAAHLNAHPPNEGAFFTTVAAATAFVHQRMRGKYHDLIGLVEFGDEAYVVTPFTNDYDNILLSLGLIGDVTEYMTFPDQGTTIGLAIDESVGLFRAFDFLDAAGNVMVIFSDGQDTQVMIHGKSVNEILAGARRANIPVFFIRTSFNKGLGDVLPDTIWKPAVEATGGKFYPANDESAVVAAIKDIDQRSSGRVDVSLYSNRQPEFGPFVEMAGALWTIALALQLTVPYFRKFP